MIEISVVLPCLNEQQTIASCVQKAFAAIEKLHLKGEVIVADNGSSDNSIEIAQAAGAKVVRQPEKGYGNAYLKGISRAQGKFIVMADADDTYNLSELESLIRTLADGAELVIGSRFSGTILPGAMSWSHRYIGNPILTGILNLFFKARISDAHSGFRAFTRQAWSKLRLKTGGMEFASEMVVEALRNKLKIKEIPITYYPRKGESKLNSFADAWRHIRFMLLYSPNYLFLLPGGILFCLGMLILSVLLFGSFTIAGHRFDIHAMILAALLTIFGFQIINLGLFAKTYAVLGGFEDNLVLERFYKIFKLEKGIILGTFLFFSGLLVNFYIVYQWSKAGFEALDELRPALFALTFMIIGAQTVFSSFFLSVIEIQRGKID